MVGLRPVRSAGAWTPGVLVVAAHPPCSLCINEGACSQQAWFLLMLGDAVSGWQCLEPARL